MRDARFSGAAAISLAFAPLLIDALFAEMPQDLPAGLSWAAAWAGSGLIAVSLLLMVREPALAHWFGGLPRMYRWHHVLGTVGYCVLLVHPLMIAVQTYQRTPHKVWHAIAPDSGDPLMLSAWVGLLMLMAGLASSFMLKLPYLLWRRLHAILGAGVLLGFVHLLLARGPVGAALLVVLIALVALLWRLLRSDMGGGARTYEVHRVRTEAGSVVELGLRALARSPAVAPGSFVQVAFFDGLGYRGCGEFHPFTVTASAPDGRIELAVKALGDCTARLQSVQPGVAALVQGPFAGFAPALTEHAALWIAGGIGVTPFVASLRAGRLTHDTELIYLFRDAQDAPFLHELAQLAQHQPMLMFRPVESAEDGRGLRAALGDVGALAGRHVFLCGPEPMRAAAVAMLTELGVPASQLHFERFDFR